MKKSFYLLGVAFTTMLVISHPAFSQKYKTAADTVKLNKEYADVSSDVADLTSKLETAKNDLPVYQAKVNAANAAATSSAADSKESANKATSGDLGDAKDAKKKANKALDQAEDLKDANNKVKDQNKKIEKLSKDLEKKQKEQQDLESMRSAIRAAQPQSGAQPQ